ncbi:hypothetical protein CEE44_00495 [Candidatus Woesearchaeota archaeon B3_Woes]|nr:MAG: hypothetical protein CEE44_00495 [Candidatus Woesearchaeota archaeon B3_Woes]
MVVDTVYNQLGLVDKLTLDDGDHVEIIRPSQDGVSFKSLMDGSGNNIWSYRNEDTRELDRRFGLTGESMLVEEAIKRLTGDESFISYDYLQKCDLGNPKVATTLGFFVKMALLNGNFLGYNARDIILEGVPYFHPELALEHTNGSQQPYLVQKRVYDEFPLFPRGLPDEFVNLHMQSINQFSRAI